MQRRFAVADWSLRLAQTCDAGSIARELGESALVRRVHGLLREAPAAVIEALGSPADCLRIERLLAHAATREAAFDLLGRASYMISKGSGGVVKATVLVPDIIPETTGEGDSEAIAICAALTDGLLGWSQRSEMATARQEGTH